MQGNNTLTCWSCWRCFGVWELDREDVIQSKGCLHVSDSRVCGGCCTWTLSGLEAKTAPAGNTSPYACDVQSLLLRVPVERGHSCRRSSTMGPSKTKKAEAQAARRKKGRFRDQTIVGSTLSRCKLHLSPLFGYFSFMGIALGGCVAGVAHFVVGYSASVAGRWAKDMWEQCICCIASFFLRFRCDLGFSWRSLWAWGRGGPPQRAAPIAALHCCALAPLFLQWQ